MALQLNEECCISSHNMGDLICIENLKIVTEVLESIMQTFMSQSYHLDVEEGLKLGD